MQKEHARRQRDMLAMRTALASLARAIEMACSAFFGEARHERLRERLFVSPETY